MGIPSDDDPIAPITIRVTRPDSLDLHHLNSIVLVETDRVRKEAAFTVPQSRHTGEIHKGAMTIRTWRKKGGAWNESEKNSVTIEEGEQLNRLRQFIEISLGGSVPNSTGSYVYVPSNRYSSSNVDHVIGALSDPNKAKLLSVILADASMTPELLNALVARAKSHPELFAEATAALNLASYQRALLELEHLISSSDREADFQRLLTANPWMFGSEYSESIDKRRWTRDEQQDFVLRRTTDGYIEIVEIKTPLNGDHLFRRDASHNSYYPSSELSKVLGQSMNYIEQFERSRDSIIVRDKEDPLKVRCKIIIGRDTSAEHREALRRLNGHLHGIEVITFDQLLRIAQRVVGYLLEVMESKRSR